MEEMPVITGLTLEQLRTLVGSAQMAMRQQMEIPPPPLKDLTMLLTP